MYLDFCLANLWIMFDADLNASRNIALELPPISRKQRLKQTNKIGFYWNVESQELLVPDAKKVPEGTTKILMQIRTKLGDNYT